MMYLRSKRRSVSRGSSYISELSDMACRGSTHNLRRSSLFDEDYGRGKYFKRSLAKTHGGLQLWSRSRLWDETLRDFRSQDRYFYGEDEYPPLLDKTDTYDGYLRSKGLTLGLEKYDEDESDYDSEDEDDLPICSSIGQRRRDPYCAPRCTQDLELYRPAKKEKERKYNFMTDFDISETDLPPSSQLYYKLYGSKWRWQPADKDESFRLRRDYYEDNDGLPSSYDYPTYGSSEYRLRYEDGLPKTSATHEKLYGHGRNWFTLPSGQ
ncbi:hypothetical protein VHEMI00325 [[Torrubiella] hemipterigena]|uniref:Uncharacterized protein n=1 Tax=[Torrubiella] hemipterigena TaxID=1531966 RepID=A0A0A1T201_9HYPO|nr:hypothetical protein VHEMI00325 [[Torrubiella] hemipterigena]